MVTVNLSKSQVINLNKLSQTGLTDVIVGLGWDPAKHENIAEKTVVTKKASLFGKLYRDTNNEWQFKAVGEADKAKSITEFANRFR